MVSKWEDGKPINTEHENGDLTVLEKSATISDLPFSSLNLDHGELIRTKEGIEEILKLLKIPVIKIEEGTKLKLTPSLLFLLGSSGNIEIIGPKSEIHFGEEEKMVLIPNAIGGEYEIKILPENEDKGEFQLFIGQITEDETFWNEIEDIIEGNILTYKINFNPLFPKENPILDDDGIIFLNQAEKRILNLKNKFDDPLLKIILKKIKQCKGLIEENKFSQTGKIIEELINLIFEFRRKNNFPESRNSSYQAITYLGRTFEIVMNNSRKKFDKKDIDLEIKKTQMLLNTAKNTLNKLLKKGKITVNNGVSFEQALENFQKGKKAYSEENLTLAKILLFIVQSLAKESILI